MTLALSVVGGTIMFVAGGLTATSSFSVNSHLFFDASMVHVEHVGLGLTKALAYGTAIPIVAGFCGLRARGSSEGVGAATTAAVIGCSFSVLLLDFVLSALGFLVLGARL
jgi:phospholipid/cholesterol/gamma-HCH transport system permease protein